MDEYSRLVKISTLAIAVICIVERIEVEKSIFYALERGFFLIHLAALINIDHNPHALSPGIAY